MTPTATTLPGRIRRALILKGMTQDDLATLLKRDPAQVSKWVRGLHHPRTKALRRIAEALEVQMAWLAFGEGPMGPQNNNEPVGAGSSSSTSAR